LNDLEGADAGTSEAVRNGCDQMAEHSLCRQGLSLGLAKVKLEGVVVAAAAAAIATGRRRDGGGVGVGCFGWYKRVVL
jgi:hypothetical protein